MSRLGMWLKGVFKETSVKIVSAVLVALLVALMGPTWNNREQVREFLGITVEVRVWLWLAIGIIAVAGWSITAVQWRLAARAKKALKPSPISQTWPRPQLHMFGLEWDLERNFLDWCNAAYLPDSGIISQVVLGPFCIGKGCGRRLVFRETYIQGSGHPVQHLENPCETCHHRVEGKGAESPLADLKREVFLDAARRHRNNELVPGWTK